MRARGGSTRSRRRSAPRRRADRRIPPRAKPDPAGRSPSDPRASMTGTRSPVPRCGGEERTAIVDVSSVQRFENDLAGVHIVEGFACAPLIENPKAWINRTLHGPEDDWWPLQRSSSREVADTARRTSPRPLRAYAAASCSSAASTSSSCVLGVTLGMTCATMPSGPMMKWRGARRNSASRTCSSTRVDTEARLVR
jgi:hypothetical protein